MCTQASNRKTPCNNLCVRYHEGICHNYCLLTAEQWVAKEKELAAKKSKLKIIIHTTYENNFHK